MREREKIKEREREREEERERKRERYDRGVIRNGEVRMWGTIRLIHD